MTGAEDIGGDHSLAASYRACRELCRRSGSNFVPAFRLLNREKGRAMEVIYAYCRFADDLVDRSSEADTRAYLDEWQDWVEHTLREPSALPLLTEEGLADQPPSPLRLGKMLLPALQDVVRRYRIPAAALLAVIEGVRRDLDFRPFRNFRELEEYCAQVASAVGTACLYVWGFRGDEVPPQAHYCGLAFQMTNILRDLREDAQRGRLYLPEDELGRFHCRFEEILSGVVSPAWGAALDFQIARVAGFYREAAGLYEFLEPEGRRIFGLMFSVYRRLFQKICRQKMALFRKKIGLTGPEKLGLLLRWAIWPPQRIAPPHMPQRCSGNLSHQTGMNRR